MSKKLKDLQWQPVALEGFPISMSDSFQGFVGLEECTDYGLDKETKKSKKKKAQKQSDDLTENLEKAKQKKLQKRNSPSDTENNKVPTKKVKLSNGFVVESFLNTVTPSQTNEISKENNKKGNRNKKEPQNKLQVEPIKSENMTKKVKPKLGEVTSEKVSDLTPEDMLLWSEFKLQEPIMRALTELGFKTPTKIQQLTLPAAIHGRRDILGAAETGSGKTLAFGLPILSGILKLKEEAAAKNLDVYDIPFKKTSVKKKNAADNSLKDNPRKGQFNNMKKISGKTEKNTKKCNQNKTNTTKKKPKESSEDGYGSGESNAGIEEKSNIKKLLNKKYKSADEYIKEIEVPLRKKDNSTDEGNDSDDENYVHLSEMLDSDDLADSESENDEAESDDIEVGSDDSETESNSNETDSDGDDIQDDVEGSNADESRVKQSDDEDVILGDHEQDVIVGGDGDIDDDLESNSAGGVGCVRVVDDVQPPAQAQGRTGKPLYALVLTPTRELAMQVSRHLAAVAKYTGIRVCTVVGGLAAVKQERALRAGPELVVGTPGRLWELLSGGEPHLNQLHALRFLAIDETDRMLERGHFLELRALLERLHSGEAEAGAAGRRAHARQTFVFSATLTLVHELPAHMRAKKVTSRGKIINRKVEKMTPQQKVRRLVELVGMTDPKVVDLTTENLGSAARLTECRIPCSHEHKDAYLYYLLSRHPGRTIVFCNSIGSVRRLSHILSILKCRPLPLHASMPQRQRLKNLERFSADAAGVLVATDVAARGLDVPGVDHVLQYQVPRTAENYVHRSGRTARAHRDGLNVVLVEPAEGYLYSKLCRTLHKTREVPVFPACSATVARLQEAVNAARDLDALELRARRAAHARAWRERAARDMDIIIDERDLPAPAPEGVSARALQARRRHLERLLSRAAPPAAPPVGAQHAGDSALQVMKRALESGELKKQKRRSKNAPLLALARNTDAGDSCSATLHAR